MAGGNRAFTLQDVIGTLNQAQSDTSNDTASQVNQIMLAPEGVKFTETVSNSTGTVSVNWNSTADWGGFQWT